mmetsp:Transcript_3339/g.6184  ORF Transcript_3339/g.6184 Transcript_3339/m.6184 type:complete len:139 (+) Transcript_3339:658-1074(+)
MSGLVEHILAIALLEKTFFFNDFGNKKIQSRMAKDWGILSILVIVSIFKIAKDNNVGSGTRYILILLDNKGTHEWEGFQDAASWRHLCLEMCLNTFILLSSPFSLWQDLGQTWQSGLDECRALIRDGGHSERRFLAET